MTIMTALPEMTPWALTIGILTALLLATGAGLLWQYYRYLKLHASYRKVLAEQENTELESSRRTGQAHTSATFAADLDQAELTTRLQYPRLRDYLPARGEATRIPVTPLRTLIAPPQLPHPGNRCAPHPTGCPG
jgi:hypothetical protein